jgi:hypothetical protein
MPDHEEYLMTPVGRGMCRYESLLDGTLDLADVAKMNDYLVMLADNEAIVAKRQADKPHG